MPSDFVLQQSRIELQNDLNKIERLAEIRSVDTGLKLDYQTGSLTAWTNVVNTEDQTVPFEIADDGEHVILRIDQRGDLITKNFNSAEIGRIAKIYYIGNTLKLVNNTLNVADSIANIQKIYSFGNGLIFTNNQLKVDDDLYNTVRINSIGTGLDLDGGKKLSAKVNVNTTQSGAYEISDEQGNVIFRIDNSGHLQVKQFDSSELRALAKRDSIASTELTDSNTLARLAQLAAVALSGSYNDLIAQPVSSRDSPGSAFELADEQGRVALRITSDGHLVTKQFDSSNIHSGVEDVLYGARSVVSNHIATIPELIRTNTSTAPFELADDSGNVAFRITDQGHIVTKAFDSSNIQAGVQNVFYGNRSVLVGDIAYVPELINTVEGSGAFEIADSNGNVALRITNDGHIRTKEFDSSNIKLLPEIINDRYLHTNATTGDLEWSKIEGGENKDFKVVSTLPPAGLDSPKVVYNLLDGSLYILDIGGAASSIVGTGLVGYMLIN